MMIAAEDELQLYTVGGDSLLRQGELLLLQIPQPLIC